jgi:hypothetical protein
MMRSDPDKWRFTGRYSSRNQPFNFEHIACCDGGRDRRERTVSPDQRRQD